MNWVRLIKDVAVILVIPTAGNFEGSAQTPLLRHGEGSIRSIRFMPDGKRFASASSDGTVRMWNAESGQPIWTFDLDRDSNGKDNRTISHIFHMEVSRSEETIAISYDQSRVVGDVLQRGVASMIALVDGKTGQVIRTFTGSGPLAFSPTDEELLWVSDKQSIRLCNTKTGDEVLTIKLREGAQNLALSPDGKKIAVATGPIWRKPSEPLQPIVALYDSKTGALIREFPRQYTQVTGIAFSANGKKLLIGGFNTPRVTTSLWDLSLPSSAEPKTILVNENERTRNYIFSPDSALLIYSHDQFGRPALSVKNLATQKSRTYKIEYEPKSLAVSRDGTVIVLGSENGRIRLLRILSRP